MKKNLALLVCTVIAWSATAQSKKEMINTTSSFRNTGSTNVLSVENIQGSVKVEAYNGDKVILEAEKTITASDQKEIEKGMREMKLVMKESGDTIYVYLDAPFIFRKQRYSRNHMINTEDVNYKYNFNITLKVPQKTNLYVSTVNHGDVEVTGITGDIKARNVNGGILLANIAGKTDANTVNGRIEVTYISNPPADSKFRTVNGDVHVNYVSKLNANVSFKSMNGQFYTDIPDMELLPVKVIKNTSSNNSGTVYKIDKNQSYKVGKGSIALAFETLNGNIYLKKK